MTRTMYDAVTAGNMPGDGDLYAYYVDGLYANGTEVKRDFPGKIYVPITIGNTAASKGMVLDCEPGDASPSAAVAWCVAYPGDNSDLTVYCDTSTWPSVRQAFQSAGVTEPNYWVANYDNNPVIPAGAVAKQYSTGGHDTSVVADFWPGIDGAVSPSAPASNSGNGGTVSSSTPETLPWSAAGALAFAALASRSNFQDWTNDCGMFCAMAHGYGGSGWVDAAAQGKAQNLNRNQSAASPGDVHFWVQQGDWSAGHGHIAVQSATPGKIWSNDLVREGHIDLAAITGPVNLWGQVYMGWAHAADAFSQSWGTNPYWSAPDIVTTTPGIPFNSLLLETSMSNQQIKAGFQADANGHVNSAKLADLTVVVVPPAQTPQFGGSNVQVQFGADFGKVKLRVASRGGASQGWRVNNIVVDSNLGNSYLSLAKGEMIVSIARMPFSATDKADQIPVTVASWAF